MRLRIGFALIAALASAPVTAQTAPAAAPAPARRPAADFATLPFMTGPQLSPDGRRIAAKLAFAGKQVLAIVDLLDATKQPVHIGLGELDLQSWSWVNDEWLAIEVGTVSQMAGDPIYVSRVAGVQADGVKITPIAFKEGGQSARIIWLAQDGTPRILMSMQKSIYLGADFWPAVSEVDVSTGRTRQLITGTEGVMRWYADQAIRPALATP